jgi:hypothetical protein
MSIRSVNAAGELDDVLSELSSEIREVVQP